MADRGESALVAEQKRLICSDDFDKALSSGGERTLEIDGTLRESDRSNYDVFYDIMLRSRGDVREALDKRKKDRTPAENELVAAFKKRTSAQYKQVRDMILVGEDEGLDADGVTNTLPKKLVQLVDRLSNVAALLRYLGHGELEAELSKRGIKLSFASLESVSDVFESDTIRSAMEGAFEEACSIQRRIDENKREIVETVFETEVPRMLQYDKDANPSGIRPADFKKLVQIQARKMKAVSEEAKDKVEMQATAEAENKHCDSMRLEVLREKYMSLMDEEGGK